MHLKHSTLLFYVIKNYKTTLRIGISFEFSLRYHFVFELFLYVLSGITTMVALLNTQGLKFAIRE